MAKNQTEADGDDGANSYSHPLAGVTRFRFRCDRCDQEMSIYVYGQSPAAICECGDPMDEISIGDDR